MKKINKQWVYVDDSGDAGFRIGTGSSRYLVMAAVVFHEAEEIEHAADAVKQVRIDLGWSEYREFKSNKTSVDIKKHFLEAVCKQARFSVRAIVIDKTKIYSNELKNNTTSFYNYTIRQLLSKAPLNHAKITLDGHADRNYKKQAKAYIRRIVDRENRKITDIRFIDSTKSDMVQIADMVAGAIRRNLEGKTDGKICLDILSPAHIEDIWHFR